MAASASIVGWSRDSYWQQPSTYTDTCRANHLAIHGSAAAMLSTQVAATTVRDQEQNDASGSGAGEGGDYSLRAHELIASSNSLYEVLETLGRGTFGQVVRCWKKDTHEVVALKILKNLPCYTKQGQVEVDVLTKLSRVSADEFNFVRAYESFCHHGHICIVFELLHVNLYEYLKCNRFHPLPLKHVRPIAQQVLTCLQKLSELGLVHADLKPENIMLVDPDRQPFRVKVIDFGSTTVRSRSTTTYLQSRYYRAPEIILGQPFDESIDMWSLGCVLAELYLGWPLFPGTSEYDQINYICQMLGPPPPCLMRNLEKTKKFFNRSKGAWTLKPPYQYHLESNIEPKETRKFIFTSVESIAYAHRRNHGNEMSIEDQLDIVQFVQLLTCLLNFDPRQRITPTQATQHPFITMQHLAMHTNSFNVREWIQCMQVCCHSRTTHSLSPPIHPSPHMQGATHSSPHVRGAVHSSPHTPAALATTYHHHHSQVHLSSASNAAAAGSTNQTQQTGLTTLPNPTTFSYHLAPSTLAYLPLTSDLATQAHSSSAVAIDTGYVSGEPSPTEHAQMGYHFDMKQLSALHNFSDGYKQQPLTTPTQLHPSHYHLVPTHQLHPHDTYWMLHLQQHPYGRP